MPVYKNSTKAAKASATAAAKPKRSRAPANERVEYGLPLVTITEQELREVREGYATGPRLKVFEKNPGDAPCRVRITMWELIVINDNRRLFKTAPPIVLGDSIPDIVRWTASDKYEAGLKKKLAARMAADGGN